MPTILLKKSDTASAVPSTANLTNLAGGAEVAVNTADKRMFTMNSSSAVVELGTNPSSLTCADVSATLIKAASANITNLSAASATVTTGNLTFSSTAQRITGDFSNATVANRLMFQTSTANAATVVGALPSGTGTEGRVTILNNSDPTASSGLDLRSLTTEAQIRANNYGGGTLPMTFLAGGSERVRITTTGNLLVGTTTDVSGRSGVISDVVGDVRNIPSAGTTKTTAYTLAITDNGEFVTIGTGGSVIVPNNTFSTGNAISVYNDTTGNVSLNISTTTAYVVGTNTNRTGVTLATRGIATVLFINPSYCILSGNLT